MHVPFLAVRVAHECLRSCALNPLTPMDLALAGARVGGRLVVNQNGSLLLLLTVLIAIVLEGDP